MTSPAIWLRWPIKRFTRPTGLMTLKRKDSQMNELNFRIGNFTISFSEQALAAHDHRHAKPLLEQAETLVARFRAFLTVRHASPVDADWWKTYYRFLNRYAS